LAEADYASLNRQLFRLLLAKHSHSIVKKSIAADGDEDGAQ
jgi:hypothetical protein